MYNIRKKLDAWYKRELFQPSFPVGIFINNAYLPRRALFRFIKKSAGYVRGDVLDIGCGSKPYEHLFMVSRYVGVDIENQGHAHQHESIDHFYDGNHLPFNDTVYDSAVCFEVLEHVFEPDLFLSEINRVLKPGGTLVLTTPFMWNEHEVPNDYGRYSSYGLRYLMEQHGFEVVMSAKLLNGPEFLPVLLQMYFIDIRTSLTEKLKYVPFIRIFLFLLWLPCMVALTITGLVLSLFFRDNRLYYNNGMVVKKK